MRIAVVRRECSLKKAGAERYCANLIRSLQRLGHDVTFVGETLDAALQPAIPFLPVATSSTLPWYRHHAFAQAAATTVRRRSFDIVHGLSRAHGLTTYRLTDPLQTHWVNVFYRPRWWRAVQHWNPRHQLILRLERELYGPRGPRRIIVQSALDGRLLGEYFGVDPARLRLVHNGVDLQTFTPGDEAERHECRAALGLDPHQPVIVFASMDFRRKGLATLLRGTAAVRHLRPTVLVIGQGDIRRYQQLSDQLGLGSRVRFLGRQSGLRRFYLAGDVFALPTIYEPFPNVNLEAWACGLPVITTRSCGTADLLQPGLHGQLLPDAWSVEELTGHLEWFFSRSSAERQALSQHCAALARQYPLERNALATLAVFEELRRDAAAA
jgi:UDP-glucose:(heptosyl)LPS alpha-1,3-glucosyltransferase